MSQRRMSKSAAQRRDGPGASFCAAIMKKNWKQELYCEFTCRLIDFRLKDENTSRRTWG